MGAPENPTPRAAWWEVLGAWLHLWTPPRGVEVPPVPWRWVAAIAAGVAAVVAVGLALAVPAIDEAKREGVTEEARQAAVKRRAREAFLRHDQRVTVVDLGSGRLAPQVRRRRRSRARAPACARASCARGGSSGCAATRRSPSPAAGCATSASRCGSAPGATRRSASACPFVAVVAADRRSVAWCKVNLLAGEGAAFAQVHVPLPKPCAR